MQNLFNAHWFFFFFFQKFPWYYPQYPMELCKQQYTIAFRIWFHGISWHSSNISASYKVFHWILFRFKVSRNSLELFSIFLTSMELLKSLKEVSWNTIEPFRCCMEFRGTWSIQYVFSNIQREVNLLRMLSWPPSEFLVSTLNEMAIKYV